MAVNIKNILIIVIIMFLIAFLEHMSQISKGQLSRLESSISYCKRYMERKTAYYNARTMKTLTPGTYRIPVVKHNRGMFPSTCKQH